MAYLKKKNYDRAERNDLKSRLWLFFPPFLFPPKKGKKKRRINSKNRDFKSSLSARSKLTSCEILQIIDTDLCAGLNIVFPTVD